METKDTQKRIAVVITDGFEEAEFTEPMKALEDAGWKAELLSIKSGDVKAWDRNNWGKEYSVDKTVKEADPESYDGLVLPGGVMNPDKLRMDADVVRFVTHFISAGKPIAAICHGPWTLIETGKLKGRKLTSYPSLRTDLVNAGATWVDQEVVVDRGLVTSRKVADLPAFCRKMVEEIKEGTHTMMRL
jgi:protease I